jgi:Flp pilus assembly protein TadD
VKINMLGLLATRYPSVALRRLLDLHEENQDHVGIVAQIAVTAANLGDFDTAMRYLGMAMGIEPNNASHVFNAAVIMDRAGQTKDAITYYEKALEVDAVYGGNRSVPREVIYERLANIR